MLKWLCFFGIMAGLVSCGVDVPKETKTSYETIIVEKQDISVPVKFSAKLKGQSDVTISPQVSGQLMKICVSEGQQVKKGTTLFVIDSRNAQLELEAAQANLQAAEASARSAKLEYESNKNLFEKNIVSRYMLDNSENSYNQAQAAVSQARAAVSRAKVNLGFCTITSPVEGIIGEIPVTEGIQVTPGTQLTIVSGNTMMDALFSIPESVLEQAVASGYEGKIEDALKKISGRDLRDEERHGISAQGTCFQRHRCGERRHGYHRLQGHLPQPRWPAVQRHPGYHHPACRQERRDGCSANCRGAFAGQVAGL